MILVDRGGDEYEAIFSYVALGVPDAAGIHVYGVGFATLAMLTKHDPV